MKDSIIRTVVPLIVGTILTALAALKIDVDEASLTVVITPIVVGLYYIVVRIFEVYVSPKFGWLLGLAKQPEYHAVPSVEASPFVDPA